MMNSHPTEQPAAQGAPRSSDPPTLPDEDDGTARDRWRRVRCGLGMIAERRVGALLQEQEQKDASQAAVDSAIRSVTNTVYASKRAMEIEDNLDAKTKQSAAEGKRDYRAEARAKLKAQEDVVRDELARFGLRGAAPGAAGGGR